MKKIIIVIGARPNFVKAKPLIETLKDENKVLFEILHSGQHYDKFMNKKNLDALSFPKIKFQLNISHKNFSRRMLEINRKIYKVLSKNKFDGCIVFGDVNTSLAASLAANRLKLPVFHIESGLRSNDPRMPEEINRIIIDNIAELHFTTEKQANINLKNEGFNKNSIFLVGNLMIECLLKYSDVLGLLKKKNKEDYYIATFHRSETIYSKENLEKLLKVIFEISKRKRIIVPIHPATKKQIMIFGLNKYLLSDQIKIIPPLDYINFQKKLISSKGIITDSGGIQEEASFMKIPVATIRENTERPITLETGFNKLFSKDNLNATAIFKHLNKKHYKNLDNVLLNWDTYVSKRITKEIYKWYAIK
jgi:UDP-N-acetylglucosamine 2-epimerase (non-hydrolysing)